MAGILDPKERIIDTIITPVGRAQIATGELKIEFASFTDRQMYYSTGSNGELDDPGARIYFEAYSTDSDLIVQELDADSNIAPFQTDSFSLYGGEVITTGSSSPQANVRIYANALAEDSIDSFKRQMMLGSRNFLKNELVDNFSITPESATFFTEQSARDAKAFVTASLDDVESLWQDYRVARTSNYQFLPPVTGDGNPLGDYTKINQDPPEDFDSVMKNLVNLQKQKFTFSNTRTTNDILGQIFEVSDEKLAKLVIIDAGSYTVDGRPDPHVFYAGKMYRDTRGALTFINIFTLVFE